MTSAISALILSMYSLLSHPSSSQTVKSMFMSASNLQIICSRHKSFNALTPSPCAVSPTIFIPQCFPTLSTSVYTAPKSRRLTFSREFFPDSQLFQGSFNANRKLFQATFIDKHQLFRFFSCAAHWLWFHAPVLVP